MAASQFGPVTQNATPAPKQTEQVGGPDPSGNLQPINIDGAGNLLVAVTGAGSGGTSSVDESGFAAGVSAGTPAMGAYQTSPTALTNNQLGIIALDANRNVKVNIVAGSSGNAAASATGAAVPASADYQGFNGPTGNLTGVASENLDYDTGAGSRPQTIMGIALPASGGPVAGGTNTNPVQIGDAGGSLTVDGSVTVTQATASNLKAQVTGAGTAGTADTGVQTIQGIASMTPVQVSQATAASLNATVVGTGTFAAQVTAVGTVADDLTTPGNPVMVGGTAKSFDGTDPGNVSAEDDVTRTITDLQRRLFVNNVHPQYWSYHSDGSSALSAASVKADPGAGYSIFVTDVAFSTGAATACNIFLADGDGTKMLGPYYLEAVAGRGVVVQFLTPKQITAHKSLTVTTSASIAQGVDISGFIAKV